MKDLYYDENLGYYEKQRRRLWDYFCDYYELTLTESELDDIIDLISDYLKEQEIE